MTENIPSMRSVALGIWVLAGSRNESKKNGGISHFVEHMLFKGTSRRTAMDIADEMDKIGGQMNAYTTKELTCYYARVLDSHFDAALDVLSDMFFNSKFDETEVSKEKNVILEEISMYEDTPEDLAHDILQHAVWEGDPLGLPILGTRESVGSFCSADFKNYVKGSYRPENIVVAAAGNFDESAVLKKIESVFSDCTGGAGYSKPEFHPVYKPSVVKREKDVEQLHLCLAFPGVPLGSEQSYAAAAFNTVFGGGMSSRLFQNIREKHGLVYSIYSYNAAYRDAGLCVIYAALNPQSAESVIGLIKKEIDGLFAEKITAEQLSKTKEQLKSNYLLGLESTSARMSAIARSEILLDRIYTPDETIEKIEAISLDGIYALAESVFNWKDLSVSAVGKVGALDFGKIIANL